MGMGGGAEAPQPQAVQEGAEVHLCSQKGLGQGGDECCCLVQCCGVSGGTARGTAIGPQPSLPPVCAC